MRSRTRVKICGITRVEDAECAVALGADAIGMVFWPRSPRAVSLQQARSIAEAMPALVTTVGVFVDMPPADVTAIVDSVGLHAVQLHGDERIDDYGRVRRPLIKAVQVETTAATEVAAALPAHVTLLVDAPDCRQRGGTGRTADWAGAASLAGRRRVMLAGGLTPSNVAEAVRTVRPWAVDVSSGVEVEPGVKSADRLRAFFAALDA